jgi:hypothetical protein
MKDLAVNSFSHIASLTRDVVTRLLFAMVDPSWCLCTEHFLISDQDWFKVAMHLILNRQ